jgi:hypothetical protein
MFAERWPIARERELIQLWDEGKLSAAQIARRIGGFERAKDGGRSAILGKVHRLGLAPRKANFTPEELAQKRQAQREAEKQRDHDRAARKRAVRDQDRVAVEVAKLIQVERVNEERKQSSTLFDELRLFSQRTSNQCRFMLNDAVPFIACGAVTPPGESWCLHCRDIVMAKPAPILSDEERFRRAMAFKKNAISRTVTSMPTAKDQAA